MKKYIDLIKKLFEEKKYDAKDIRSLTDSGYQRYIEHRYAYRIKSVERDILKMAHESGKAVVTTFEDKDIQSKQKEFVKHFEQKGYTVKEFDTVVLILW